MKTAFVSPRFSVCLSLLLGASVVMMSPRLLGQGAINFNNRAVSANPVPVVAPIYGPEPGNQLLSLRGNATTNGGTVTYSGALLSGTGWTVQLWAAPQAQGLGALAPISTTTMRPAGALAGFIQPPAVAPVIANAPGGSLVNFEIRIWENRGGTVTTWAQVMADPSIALRNTSGIFTTAVAEPPNTPPNLVGLTSFNIFIAPEPGVLPLASAAIILVFLTSLLRRDQRNAGLPRGNVR